MVRPQSQQEDRLEMNSFLDVDPLILNIGVGVDPVYVRHRSYNLKDSLREPKRSARQMPKPPHDEFENESVDDAFKDLITPHLPEIYDCENRNAHIKMEWDMVKEESPSKTFHSNSNSSP